MKCSFCGTTIEKGYGLIYVKKDGKVLNFCTRKCEKNMIKLGRKARTTTWTEEARQAKQQRMAAGTAKKKKKVKAKPAKTAAKTPAKTATKTAAKKAVKKAAKTVKKDE